MYTIQTSTLAQVLPTTTPDQLVGWTRTVPAAANQGASSNLMNAPAPTTQYLYEEVKGPGPTFYIHTAAGAAIAKAARAETNKRKHVRHDVTVIQAAAPRAAELEPLLGSSYIITTPFMPAVLAGGKGAWKGTVLTEGQRRAIHRDDTGCVTKIVEVAKSGHQ